jgi:hypothetical protein
MRVFAIGIEHALDVSIKPAQHPDARVHHEVTTFCSADQTPDRGLPFLEILFGFRQFHDVVGSILERDELASIGQGNRIVKRRDQSTMQPRRRDVGASNRS